MSRHHNTKHPERGRSHYGARLTARGLSKAPALPDANHLRQIQEARVRRNGSPFPTRQDEEALAS